MSDLPRNVRAVQRRGRRLFRRARRVLRSRGLLPAARPKPEERAEERVESRANRIDERLLQHVVVVRQFTRTFPTSNVWVLQDGREAALIDAGFGDEQCIEERRRFFERELPGLDFKHILITHHHFDHSSGARRLRDILRAETAINPIDEVILHTPSESNEDLPDERDISERARVWREEALNAPIDRTLADGECVRVGGLTVRAVHTPGHTAGHNCYFVEETGVLFTGDNVLGVGTSAIGPPPHGDLQAYLDSLLRMRELESGLFAPGHGPVVRATDAKIKELLDHRAFRDKQILDLVERGYEYDRQLRRALYPELPKGLRRAAHGQVRSHLAKMVGQGLVAVEELDGGKSWKVALTR
jgi:glyoxylase-like metal-dependent hydrolase (beta-lactamase superfamily II)